jgi:hypothetical protein
MAPAGMSCKFRSQASLACLMLHTPRRDGAEWLEVARGLVMHHGWSLCFPGRCWSQSSDGAAPLARREVRGAHF